jgi:L-iditol 2-dehydrogenase
VRAAVYYSNNDVRVEERPRPVAGPGELVFRVEASGICGSDVMEWYRIRKAPLVLGHEVAGEVVEAGPGVAAFKPGDRIVATHHVPCDACRYCLAGQHPYCDTLRATTFDPGGFSEFVRLPAVNVERGTFLLPDGMTYEEGTFVEPLACVVRGLRVARFTPGQAVAVLGSGISGILFVRLAKALGAGRVFATDVSPRRLEFAREAGASAAIPATDDVPALIREANGGRAADLVVVSTAALPAIGQAFRAADRGGTVLLFAPATPGETYPLPLFDVWNAGLTIAHSYAGPPADMRAAIELIAAKRVDVVPMITHRLPLARTAEGFRLVADAGDSLKVIVEPQK